MKDLSKFYTRGFIKNPSLIRGNNGSLRLKFDLETLRETAPITLKNDRVQFFLQNNNLNPKEKNTEQIIQEIEGKICFVYVDERKGFKLKVQ
ncbi:MAG: hypothetical protein ACOCQR_01035 [bacterium]